MANENKILSNEERTELLKLLEERFNSHLNRHQGIVWMAVKSKLEEDSKKLWSLNEMEKSGGKPDVVGTDPDSGEFLFFDCATESPIGRRSLCYDRAALDARKKNKPANCVLDVAEEMGVELLNEEQYRFLQSLETFDLKTSSWVVTPLEIRERGGAIFCDRRYNHVFTYHNGADSYYSARGFRALLKV